MSEPQFLDPIRERRRLRLSGLGILLGLMLGLGLGLFYSRSVDPIVVRNVAPDQLQAQDKRMFIVAAVQEYAAEGDLQQVIGRLLEAEPDGDPYQVAADTVCILIRSGEISTVTDIEVIRNLRAIYESRGIQAECETTAFDTPMPVTVVFATPTITPTATITPIASKTPTQPFAAEGGSTPLPLITPTPNNAGAFEIVRVERNCIPEISGVLEVYVQDAAGVGIAGAAVRVSWDNGRQEQIFYTGLKPERGNDYADYLMTEGITYRVSLREFPNQLSDPLVAEVCDTLGTLLSHRVVFRQVVESD